MTVIDASIADTDKRDLIKHAARDQLIEQYRKTFGLTRRRANEEFMAHIEADEEERVERQTARTRSGPKHTGSTRKRDSEKARQASSNELPA